MNKESDAGIHVAPHDRTFHSNLTVLYEQVDKIIGHMEERGVRCQKQLKAAPSGTLYFYAAGCWRQSWKYIQRSVMYEQFKPQVSHSRNKASRVC